MITRLTYFICLLMLVLASSGQVSLYVSSAKSEHVIQATETQQVTATYSPLKPNPISTSDKDTSIFAIVQSRGLTPVSNELGADDDFSPYDPQLGAANRSTLTTVGVLGNLCLPLAYGSRYRLSGWKESNALYVALNGQFV